jgi:hypothetical protein
MIGFLSKALSAPTHGRDVMGRKNTPTLFERQSSLRFLILGRRESSNRINLVVAQTEEGMTVTVVDEGLDVMIGTVGDRQDVMTEDVDVMIEAVTPTGTVIETEAGTLVGEVPDRMMTSPSKF